MNNKTIIKGKIRIISPVHIGGAQEKHALKGLDYIVNKGNVYFLDEYKLIAHFGPEKYSNALASGKLEELCGSINLTDYSKKVISNISGEIGTDIKINIKHTLSNRPIIPGSSLKGALRSVFVNKFGGAKTEYDRNNRPKTIEPFGEIAQDINRYMIVSDSEFSQSTFVNTKTFNLRGSNGGIIGGWKHELKGGNSDNFDTNGFTFPHEVIPNNDFGDLRIVFNTKFIDNAKNTRDPKILKINDSIEAIYKGSQQEIFSIIQSYTESFIAKELAFFNKFEADRSVDLIEFYEYIRNENQKMPILRLGLGSGFHSMTGDPYDSHDIDEVGKPGKYKGKNSSKSRKIAFSGSGDDIRLFPMGFVQMMTNEYYDQHYRESFEARKATILAKEALQKEKQKADNLAYEAAKMKAESDTLLIAEKDELARLEALKPKMIEINQLKKAKWVDGIVVGQNGKMLQFRPFITGFDDKIFEISYSAGMPLDTIIQVMCMSPNVKMLQFQGAPKVKQ